MIPSRGLKDPALLVAVAQIQSLAWELPYATGAAIKEKKKKNSFTKQKQDSKIPKPNLGLPRGKH